jgi:hypothetical protein
MQVVKFADADNDEKDGPDSAPSDNLYVKNLPLNMSGVSATVICAPICYWTNSDMSLRTT